MSASQHWQRQRAMRSCMISAGRVTSVSISAEKNSSNLPSSNVPFPSEGWNSFCSSRSWRSIFEAPCSRGKGASRRAAKVVVAALALPAFFAFPERGVGTSTRASTLLGLARRRISLADSGAGAGRALEAFVLAAGLVADFTPLALADFAVGTETVFGDGTGLDA